MATPFAWFALAAAAVISITIAVHGLAHSAQTWNGLVVAPEHRCSPYDRSAYPYSQSAEPEIVASMGGKIYGPYTGRYFASMRDTDIEHIVAVSEAHDSGLCAAGSDVRSRFASDPLNLTLAAPDINRCSSGGKCAYDAAEWLPPLNRCWFAARVVAVKRKYALTIDRHEVDALERVFSACTSTDMIFTAGQGNGTGASPGAQPADIPEALRLYDDNSNGRITCKEARRHGIAPVPRGHPAYPFMRDGDGDALSANITEHQMG